MWQLSVGKRAIVTSIVAMAFFVAASGCATLRAPVEFESQTTEETPPLTLNAVEGRPDGLLLRIESREPIEPDAASLHLMRAATGEKPQIYRDIELGEQFRRAIVTEGLEFLERNLAPDQHVRYQLRLLDESGAVLSYSNRVDVRWKEPPPRPANVTAQATTSNTVELRWDARRNLGAVVFRRNVLDDDSKLERIGQVGPNSSGLFVDRDAGAGVVYAYRVSLALRAGELTQFGPPSEAVYVDVPLP